MDGEPMSSVGQAIFPVVLAVVIWLLVHMFRRRQLILLNGLPPCNAGWIPFLGCAIEFGKRPLLFIEQMHQQLGAVFTLYLGGRRMTYLMDEEDYTKYFMQSQHVDFQKAVHLFVANAASVTSESFLTYHTGLHDMVKGKLATHQLSLHKAHLEELFKNRLDELRLSGRLELNNTIRQIMYPSVIKDLFGERVINKLHDKQSLQELQDSFVLYDHQFEYGTQIPHVFLRSWAKAKQQLLGMFQDGISRIKAEDTTLLKSLHDSVDKKHAPNYGLLMLWASLANAVPVAFWTVALILNSPQVLEKVKKIISDVETCEGELEYTEENLHKLKYLRCCFLEAIRIRSPGVIVRMVVEPFQVKGYTVPKGDLLVVSPYWAHRNPKHFPDPEHYMPERWMGCDFSKNEFLPGFVAFGGGRYMCPGRWYALMELHILISMLFHKYHMTLDGKLPAPDVMHLVGVQQPQADCYVNFTPRV